MRFNIIHGFLLSVVFLSGQYLFGEETAIARPAETEEKALRDGLSHIINDLDGLLGSAKGVKDTYPKEIIDYTLLKVRSKELALIINLSIEKDIYGGMGFSHTKGSDKHTPAIHVSPYMIQLYKSKPSIVLSAFVHEAMHAKSYFMNPDLFAAIENNVLENYLYQLDALNCEARFIRGYLKNNPKFALTMFERFLDKSFYEDHLDNFSHSMMGFDMNIAFFLYKTVGNTDGHDMKIKAIEKMINEYEAKGFIDYKDEFQNYSQLVPIYTILQFTPQAVYTMDIRSGLLKKNESFSLERRHPILNSKLLKLEKIFHENRNCYISYREKINALFKNVEQ